MSLPVTKEQLIKSRVHFGHIARKWNPKMKNYVLCKKHNYHIIDLDKTISCLEKAVDFTKSLIISGKRILFVGTKSQAKEKVSSAAISVGMPYVSEKWKGGTLTNFSVFKRNIRKMQMLDKRMTSKEYSFLTKKEQLKMKRSKAKMEINFGGVIDVSRLPAAIFVVDVRAERIAVMEANSLGIPIIGIVDTNSDPSLIDFPIPANDDVVTSISCILDTVIDAVKVGLEERKKILDKQQDDSKTKAIQMPVKDLKNSATKNELDKRKKGKRIASFDRGAVRSFSKDDVKGSRVSMKHASDFLFMSPSKSLSQEKKKTLLPNEIASDKQAVKDGNADKKETKTNFSSDKKLNSVTTNEDSKKINGNFVSDRDLDKDNSSS